MNNKIKLLILLTLFISVCSFGQVNTNRIEKNAHKVLSRTLGESNASKFVFHYTKSETTDSYSIKVEDNKIHVSGTSTTALCRGAYD